MNTTGKLASELPGSDVIEMDQAFFPNPWTKTQWLETDPNSTKLYTFRTDGFLDGYALFGVSAYDDAVHLYKILVHPSKRGTGKAVSFWSEITAELKKMNVRSVYLEVESSNATAIKFYEKLNFKLLRRNKAYYSNGEDALIMSLTL